MTIPKIDRDTLLALQDQDDVWLVHAEGPRSFRRAHLPGAICFEHVEQVVAVLRHDEAIVVYGHDALGEASQRLARDLHRQGFTQVHWYAEGLVGWRAAGGRVEGNAPDGPQRS